MQIYTTFLFTLLFSLSWFSSQAQTCTFQGNNSNNWSDSGNWSCGNVPNTSNGGNNVVIPVGHTVIYDLGVPLVFQNRDLTVNGSLNMQGQNLSLTHNNTDILIPSTGVLMGISVLTASARSQFTASSGATITVDQLILDDDSEFVVDANCLVVTSQFSISSDASITGSGCIEYQGDPSDFTVNSSSAIIFGQTCSDLTNCQSLTNGQVLPVEFTSFTAEAWKGEAILRWETASETQNSHFEVQRSLDGQDWESLGQVEGAGYSAEPLSYRFTDAKPLGGTSFYRLKQVDFDGSFEYSDMVSIRMEENLGRLSIVSENPARESLTLSWAGAGEWNRPRMVRVHGLGGQPWEVPAQAKSDAHLRLDISTLPDGIYILNLQGQAVKFIKRG